MAITFAQLRSFVTVVRAGSVTAAADELWVTQPSVSAALAALTQEVGVDLFTRSGRTLQLTEAGTVFARHAERALGAMEQGLQAAREAGGAVRRRVRVAAVTTAGEHLVPSLLRGFAAAHPEADVELHVGNRERVFRMLRTGEADVAVTGRPPAGSPWVAEPILDNRIVLIAAPDDPFTDGTPVPVQRLQERTWLMREEGSGTRAMARAYLDAHGLQPACLTLGSNGAITQAAALGLGVAMQSEIAVQGALQRGALGRITCTEPPADDRSWYLIRPAEPTREAVIAFIEHVRAPTDQP